MNRRGCSLRTWVSAAGLPAAACFPPLLPLEPCLPCISFQERCTNRQHLHCIPGAGEMVLAGKYATMTAKNGKGTGGRTTQHQELADAVNKDFEADRGVAVTAEQVGNKIKTLPRSAQRACA